MRNIIHLLRCVDPEYKPASIHKIGGKLLEINYNRYTDTKSEYIVKKSDIFRI